MFNINIMSISEDVMDSIHSVICVGTLFIVNILPSVLAAPKSIIIVADVIVASNIALQNRSHVS